MKEEGGNGKEGLGLTESGLTGGKAGSGVVEGIDSGVVEGVDRSRFLAQIREAGQGLGGRPNLRGGDPFSLELVQNDVVDPSAAGGGGPGTATTAADRPRRGPTPYMVFRTEKWAEVYAAHPNATFGALNTLFGEMWAGLSEADKTPYREKSERSVDGKEADAGGGGGGGSVDPTSNGKSTPCYYCP